MQELIGILAGRLEDLRYLVRDCEQNKLVDFKLMKVDFNMIIQEDRWKKIVENYVVIQDPSNATDDNSSKIKTLTQSYRTLFQELSLDFHHLVQESDPIPSLNQLRQASLQLSKTIKSKIQIQSEIISDSNIPLPLCSDSYNQLLKCYSERVGLTDLIENQIQYKTDLSIPDLLLQSRKANIKISNAIKQYGNQYRIYLNRAEKRRMKRLADEARKKVSPKNCVMNVSPLRKITLENMNVKNRDSLKKQKIPLPPALKKIQFPFLSISKQDQPIFFSLLPKKNNKKATTVPSQSVSHNPSMFGYNEFDSKFLMGERSIQGYQKFEKVSLSLLKKKIRDKLSRKEDKKLMQSQYCFDDGAMKKGFDESLFLSNKGLV